MAPLAPWWRLRRVRYLHPHPPMQHEFCVNIASAVQLTTRHHHLRHSQVVAWFEAMDHTCMRNAQMFGSGPIESSVVVDNHEYKKQQMTMRIRNTHKDREGSPLLKTINQEYTHKVEQI